jgi:hypothetical protein
LFRIVYCPAKKAMNYERDTCSPKKEKNRVLYISSQLS